MRPHREKRRSEKESAKSKKMQACNKGEKPRNPMFWDPGLSKRSLFKAAGANSSSRIRREKLHAVLAQSIFPVQHAQDILCSDHFWRSGCRKGACPSGAKHMPKSKFTKHTRLEPFLEVAMSKKCMLSWREAHFFKSKCTRHFIRSAF